MLPMISHGFSAERLSRPILGLTLLLTLLGFIMMVSAGGGDWDMYARPQLLRIMPALALMLVIPFIPLWLLMRYAYLIYGMSLLVLVGVDIIGHTGMGAQRWIKLAGVNIQPSEFMKLAIILALARYFHQRQPEDIRRLHLLILPVMMMVVPAALILRQPNLGTATITLMIGLGMLFLAGLQWRYIIVSVAGVVASAPVAWHFLHDYQKQRVLTFLDPNQDPLGAGYNILQSMIAIGSGGFFGKGFLQGSQSQLDFLPEKQTDFIFTMLAEEFGFVGGFALIAVYFALMAICTSVALRSRSTFGAMVASGIGLLLFVHVMINISMVMGLIPVVGVPLPLLSYGGSITVSTILAMGLLLNVYANRQQSPTRDTPNF